MSAETKTAGKRKQRLLKREKDHLVISHRKLQGYYRFQTEVNWSCHNHPVLHKDMPIQYQQNLISNNLFIFQILFYNFSTFSKYFSTNPVINFSTPAKDLKYPFQGVTVPQPMPKIVAQTPQFSNPPPNLCVIAILKYCH